MFTYISLIDNVQLNRLDASVPEPAIWGMLLLGFAGLGGVFRARRRTLRAAN